MMISNRKKNHLVAMIFTVYRRQILTTKVELRTVGVTFNYSTTINLNTKHFINFQQHGFKRDYNHVHLYRAAVS